MTKHNFTIYYDAHKDTYYLDGSSKTGLATRAFSTLRQAEKYIKDWVEKEKKCKHYYYDKNGDRLEIEESNE